MLSRSVTTNSIKHDITKLTIAAANIIIFPIFPSILLILNISVSIIPSIVKVTLLFTIIESERIFPVSEGFLADSGLSRC